VQDARAAHTHTSALGHEELKEQTTTMVLNQEFLGEKCGGAVVVLKDAGEGVKKKICRYLLPQTKTF